ncbi:MAG: RNA methyltransferase [Actinomycetota bacterium]|nr:RNA methyltransferase [Actinomycetota bacterium]
MFVAEGIEVVRTGLLAGAVPESLYVASGAADADGGVAEVVSLANAVGARIFELAPGVVERVSSTVTPQPVLAIFPALDLPSVPEEADLVVVLADVRDPGNAGTVLRTADASGAGAVVCCGGTVDPYNPKTVRASAGSLFHVPVVLAGEPVALLETLGASGLRRLGAVARGGQDYAGVDWSVRTALVLGNEAWGLPEGLVLDGLVGIPMSGRAESLNVGMACAVLCFEALRQRRSGPGRRRSTMPG